MKVWISQGYDSVEAVFATEELARRYDQHADEFEVLEALTPVQVLMAAVDFDAAGVRQEAREVVKDYFEETAADYELAPEWGGPFVDYHPGGKFSVRHSGAEFDLVRQSLAGFIADELDVPRVLAKSAGMLWLSTSDHLTIAMEVPTSE